MTRTLILTRHAKSSWDTPGLPDHERPLNKRGRKSAEALGDWLKERGWIPDQVLCSASERTRETWALMGLDVKDTSYTDGLYHVSGNQILRTLNGATGNTVMVLGHNPGLAEFAAEIVAEPPDHDRFSDYPTGATTVLSFDIDDWRSLAWRSGTVLDFVVPRELIE